YRLWVREVEAQLVGPDRGARLARVLAEHVLKRLVQEVRRGVVRHRRKAHGPRHDRAHAQARPEALALELEHLVVSREPVRSDELRARARLFVLDEAGVGDLATAFRIKRRLLELGLEPA